ncbi:MAG TPA: LysR substrate-binding domain-containing protein [Rhodopila sp.]|uniref:LysR substrate-binding domain-containing protein n=1 Tax=Rhodopila sp. TaxID=2480087 RepID=UPI002CE1D674|nr:LysR substrate-binding domain-containing protein [Rhodopila sp.]HVY18241.1 LysR substrate-binding domain-containing protein [Rhodopila sp.]
MPGRRLPPLHAIRAFEAAARHGSMTRAADELGVTPGAVSRHVRALETQMDTTLFLRRATGLTLTGAGEALSRAVGDALDQVAEAVSGARRARLRRLSVGAFGYFASRFLLPRWADLTRTHPGLEVDLHTSLNPLDLLPGRYDAVIVVSDAQPHAGLVTHALMPIATVPVCAPALLRDGPPDFATAPQLHARPRPDDWRRWLNHAGLGTVPVRDGGTFESIGLALEAAAAGLGFAIAIEGLLGPELERGDVVRAHTLVRPTRRHFVLQYEARLARDPALQDFAGWIREQAG